jgi:hypothetical protein
MCILIDVNRRACGAVDIVPDPEVGFGAEILFFGT